jgi:heat shock protein HtpX
VLPATGLKTHSWNTALRSILLLAGFPFLLVMMGYAIALFIVAGDSYNVETGLIRAAWLLPTIIPIALLVAAIWFAIAWVSHNKILDLVTGAKRVADPREEPRLWRLTEELCIARGMTMPRLGIIETPARNAFASGVTRDKAAVTVTRGLMEALDDRELAAVIGHELAHIRNGDARLGVIAAVFVGVITLVTDLAWNSLRWRSFRVATRGGNASNRGAGAILILIAVAIAVAAHLLAMVLRMALSRNREYLADAGAVDLTKDADAMISALRKVEQQPDMPAVPEQVRALFLHDSKLSGAAGIFATHPPIEQRIAALIRYAGGHDPGRLPPITAESDETVALPPWQAKDLSPPAGPAASAPHSPASSPPAGRSPWRPWGPRGPG